MRGPPVCPLNESHGLGLQHNTQNPPSIHHPTIRIAVARVPPLRGHSYEVDDAYDLCRLPYPPPIPRNHAGAAGTERTHPSLASVSGAGHTTHDSKKKKKKKKKSGAARRQRKKDNSLAASAAQDAAEAACNAVDLAEVILEEMDDLLEDMAAKEDEKTDSNSNCDSNSDRGSVEEKMAGVEEWMVPWVAQGERVLRHRFPNWLGEMKAVSRMSAGVLGMGIRRLEQCVRKTRGREEREAFRFLLLFAGAVRDRPATLRRQRLVQGGLMRAVRGKRGVGAGRRRRRRVYWRRRVRREEASAREARERQLQRHLQLLQRRQLEWQQRAAQRLSDLLARRRWEEQVQRRGRVARKRCAARRRWRRKQQRTAAAVARSGDCLRAGLGPARGRSSCCGTGRVQRRTTRLGGGGKEGGRGAC